MTAVSDASVSVVIPTNRGGPYLEEAVASVRAQISPVQEVILVDDGSPAPGLAEVAGFLGVRYVRQTAAGIAAARNTGVEAASSDWIAFLDDDDVWHPDRIACQRQALTEVPDAVGSHTGGWYMDSNGITYGVGWPAEPATVEEYLGGDSDFPRITTLLVRRSSYIEVGGCRTESEPSEDNDLILRLLMRGPFAAVDRQLVGYRRHASNVTRRSLRGRAASRRVLLWARREAEARGDATTARLLNANLRMYTHRAAHENTGDLIGSIRSSEWRYAANVAWWGITRVPLESVSDLVSRLTQSWR